MKIKQLIYLAALGLFASCSDDISSPSKGNADNAIVLRAGVTEGGSGVLTRAGAEDNHAKHLLFTEGTKMALRVDGTWTGHDPVNVTNPTTGTTGGQVSSDSEDSGYKHNSVTISPNLFWNDYGAADPANATTGRTQGLTIYGAAVDGENTAPTVDSWTAMSWNVGTPAGSPATIDQKTSGWATKDLLTSNNVRSNDLLGVNGSCDGTYLFESRSAGKLLEFTHVMSKITVNLTAGQGFIDNQFQTEPEVTLLGFNYTGTVNIETKAEPMPSAVTPCNISAYRDNGAAWVKANKSTLTALVFPGNSFENGTEIIRIDADGNTYYVTAQNINAAMNTKYSSTTFKQAYNYIFNITVNKTHIVVTATIKNWDYVEAAEETPLINVTASYPDQGSGTGANASFTSFSFYRSLNVNNGYSEGYSGNANSYFAAEGQPTGTLGSTPWTFSSPLYWPNHETHYFFRGVWPLTSVQTTDVETAPHVKTSNAIQVVDVKNVAYTANTYPSDLTIGMPEFTDGNKMCDSHANHTPIDQSVSGICATRGTINLQFQYVMSQVEVELQTVDDDAAVEIGSNTEVEIINVYNSGEVKMADRGIITTGEKGNYTLNTVAGGGNELKRHSAIVPQTLTYTSAGDPANVRFKVTVHNTNGTTDVYYADVEPILNSAGTAKVAPTGKWESGIHYKYILKLSKTAITTSATFKDWVTVTGSENIWF